MYFLYKVTNTVNGKVYIGQTSRTVAQRWKQHVGSAVWNIAGNRGKHALHKAIAKYGADKFHVEQIGSTSSVDQIALMEETAITSYKSHVSTGLGYNMTYGGPGTVGYVYTDADKLKMSIAQTGKLRGPRSIADKQAISAAKKALGHGPSELCIQRRKETGTGVPRPDDVKERIRASLKGRPRPPEVIEKIRVAHAARRAKKESQNS